MRRPLLTARSLCLRYKAKVELWHKGAFHVCKTSKILFVVFSSPVLRSMRPHRSELPTATKVLVASTMRSLPLKLKQIHNGILRSVYGSSKLEIFCDAPSTEMSVRLGSMYGGPPCPWNSGPSTVGLHPVTSRFVASDGACMHRKYSKCLNSVLKHSLLQT